jgi:hypothetical protein
MKKFLPTPPLLHLQITIFLNEKTSLMAFARAKKKIMINSQWQIIWRQLVYPVTGFAMRQIETW